jgi:uncharacterized ferritin-like protein (DUF455 family)
MSTTEILNVPLDVTWTFDYQIDMAKLKNLYSKAKQSQWDAETYIDWERPIDPSKPLIDEDRFGFSRVPLYAKLSDTQRERFRAHMTAQILSGILHGEQGALMTAAVLTHAVPDYEGKLYAATQTYDEARHVEVYDRYIKRLAIIYPMNSGLKSLIEMAFKGDHWVKVAIGMNMVVESLALGAFHNMGAATTCDTLRTILQMVLRDESRHVAFGHVYVKEAIARMTPDEREDIAEFTFEAVSRQRRRGGAAAGDGGRFLQVLINAGIEPQDFLKSMAEAREQGLLRGTAAPGQVHMFRDLMMPALVRVGAITERTRAKFAEQGIQIFEDTTVLEAMEDDATGEFDVALAVDAAGGEREDAPSGY